jgi:hypothetical protein
MQKRGKGNCPMCRAPTVIQADRCKSVVSFYIHELIFSLANVDWALLNFMQDWFPEESYAKLRANEQEAANEELAELGIEPSACIIC